MKQFAANGQGNSTPQATGTVLALRGYLGSGGADRINLINLIERWVAMTRFERSLQPVAHSSRALIGYLFGAAMVFSLSHVAQAADPLDWTMWRGSDMTGVSLEKNVPDKWSPKGENLLWMKPEYASRSTPIIMNGKLYTVCRHEPETTKEGEKTVCLDAKTGELIWESVHNVYLQMHLQNESVGRASPVIRRRATCLCSA